MPRWTKKQGGRASSSQAAKMPRWTKKQGGRASSSQAAKKTREYRGNDAQNSIIDTLAKHSSMDSKFLNRHTDFFTTSHDLPHWHQAGKLQFVTFHLADSLPSEVLTQLQHEKNLWLEKHKAPLNKDDEAEYHHRFSQFVDKWLDAGHGSCILKINSVAATLENTLLHFNGVRYQLHAYVIMPNHVHALLETFGNFTVQSIMHSWKSYSAGRINKLLGLTGQLWMHDSYDRIIRNERHYTNVKKYILKNIETGGVLWSL